LDICFEFCSNFCDQGLVQDACVKQKALVIGDGILFGPHVKQFLGHIFRAARLLVAAHPEGHRLQQNRTAVFTHFGSDFGDRAVHGEDVVAIDLDAFDAVANRLVNEILVAKLFVARCAEAVAIVFDEENDREVPNGGHVDGLMEITFACAAISRKHHRNDVVIVQVARERDAVGDGKHGAEVADHADDAVLGRTKVKLRSRPLVKPSRLPCHWANNWPSFMPRLVKTPKFRCKGRM
jgi:hypothetical protein